MLPVALLKGNPGLQLWSYCRSFPIGNNNILLTKLKGKSGLFYIFLPLTNSFGIFYIPSVPH